MYLIGDLFEVENTETILASENFLAFPSVQVDNLAIVKAVTTFGNKMQKVYLPLELKGRNSCITYNAFNFCLFGCTSNFV